MAQLMDVNKTQGWAKWVYSCEYLKQGLFLYYYYSLITISFVLQLKTYITVDLLLPHLCILRARELLGTGHFITPPLRRSL